MGYVALLSKLLSTSYRCTTFTEVFNDAEEKNQFHSAWNFHTQRNASSIKGKSYRTLNFLLFGVNQQIRIK